MTAQASSRSVDAADEHRPRLTASNAIDGMAVLDGARARVGSIRHLLINLESGRAEFAILTFGGLFPIGERLYPLPWRALRYDMGSHVFEADLDVRRLRHAPSYKRGDDPTFDRAYGKKVRRFHAA